MREEGSLQCDNMGEHGNNTKEQHGNEQNKMYRVKTDSWEFTFDSDSLSDSLSEFLWACQHA